MASILDLVHQQLQSGGLDQLSRQLGTSPEQTHDVVTAALPAVLGGLANHAATPDGAAAIHDTIESGGQAGGADLGFLHGGAGSGGILKHLFGNHQQNVQQTASRASGLDPAKTSEALLFLAPIVIAALMKKKQEEGLSQNQLGTVLQQSHQQAHDQAVQQQPHLGGILGGLLNRVMPGH
jgi:hypothetical protein